ncbi:MAG TPA: ATPase, T2SS/T4P/T4SS family [Polyangiales bacterium]|nr:ATPase, T2SS/T4P/T4SS family [Polyangiales bacterium]
MDAHDRMFGEIAVRLELLTRDQLAACRKAQAEAPRRSLAQMALALGFMSEAEIEMVALQQRKVLERRREAREGQREAAAVVTQPERPARSAAGAGASMRPQAEARVTSRPADRPSGQREAARPQRESRPRALLDPLGAVTLEPSPKPATSADTLEPGPLTLSDADEGDDARDPTVPRVPQEPRSMVGQGLLVPDLAPTPLSRAPEREERAGKKTEVPPSRARKLAAPTPANTNHEAKVLSRGAGGTLLGSSGQLQQRAAALAAAPSSSSQSAMRPAADRGWRNPSKPPPPTASTARAEALAHDPRLDSGPPTGTLAWNPASAPRPSAMPTRDTPTRYLDQLLALAVDTGASDLHAHSGSPVLARVDGALWPLTADAPLSPQAAEHVIAEIMSDEQWDALQLTGEVRFAYDLPGIGRFRAHAYRQQHGLDVVFRALPAHIADPKDLLLPARMLLHVLDARSGLFIVSGPPGAGKTTTLATLGHALANEHNLYVSTAEAPIEIVHSPGLGLIEQREIPTHAHNFAECIEQAERQGADVIVVSELSSASAIAAALQAALSGCAVLACVQADSPWAALTQLLGHFPSSERALARAQLSLALRAVFTLRLLPRGSTRGRIPAVEMLLANPQVAQLIADEQFDALEQLMISQPGSGMQTLDAALQELLRNRAISPEIAQRAARRERLEASGS